MAKISNAAKQAAIDNLRAGAVGEWDDGRSFLVLHFLDGYSGRTEPCPFCGKNHLHGKGEGHRMCHCAIPDRNMSFQNSRGETFTLKNGYILKKRPEAP